MEGYTIDSQHGIPGEKAEGWEVGSQEKMVKNKTEDFLNIWSQICIYEILCLYVDTYIN